MGKKKVTVNGKRVGRPPATHCKNGHKYTRETVTRVARGKYKGERRCAICIKNGKQRQLARHRAQRERRKSDWFF